MRHIEDIAQRLATDGIIWVRAADPPLRAALYRAAARGALVSVLPGVFADPGRADEPRIRMLALRQRDPDVVFTGRTAAALLWDAGSLPTVVEASTHLRVQREGFDVTAWRPGLDWVTDVGAFQCTDPALTAVDLVPRCGGEFIDRVLRDSRSAGDQALARLWAALHAHPQRPGNTHRARLLSESRSMPWSTAERLAHQQLHDHGITGWVANAGVRVGEVAYSVDLLWAMHHLVVEIDGFEFHSSRAAFEHDRARQNVLVEHGWRVLRFTWAMIESGQWLQVLQRCLARP
ncbi:MAG: DUF559 domain-containing protein [Propionibacteriaceae bacterium]|nr:DUF559 domain-containing protein [Propionibacteriaceae bacterium]